VDPVLLPIPTSLQTPRLLLRISDAGDGEFMYSAATASASELRRFLDWAKAGILLATVEAYCRRQHGLFYTRKQLNYLMFRRDHGQFVGCCGIVRTDWDLRQFEIGYWLSTAETGQGLMTEACQAVIEMASSVLEATKITLRCDAENIKSAAIARRLGLSREAVHPNWRRREDGTWTTLEEYGLICSGR
jgi:RimJ/RimL family protein N-acetyltransferase